MDDADVGYTPLKARTLSKVMVAIFGALILAVAVVYVRGPREPQYQGKGVTEWLRDLNHNVVSESQFGAAVAHMGTNALPDLVRLLVPHRPTPWQRLLKFLETKAGLRLRRGEDLDGPADFALMCLGTNAWLSLPVWRRLFEDPQTVDYATIPLFVIGRPSMPVLTEGLSSTSRAVRVQAAFLLAEISARHGPVVGWNVVMSARRTNFFACEIGFNGDDMRVIAGQLDSTNPLLRRASAEALGWHAGVARATVRALREALHDADERVRQAASWALRQIAPAAFTPVRK